MADLDLLRACRPQVAPPSFAVTARAREQLMTLIDTTPSVAGNPNSVSTRRKRRSRRGRLALASTSAAAAILAVVVANLGGGQTSAAAAVLRHAADTAAHQSAPPAGAVVYTHSIALVQDTAVDANGQVTNSLDRDEREIWIAPDGSGRIRETLGTNHSDERFGPGGLSREDFSHWPTSTDAVAEKLRREAEQTDVPVPLEMFVRAGDYLRETGAPPAVRAALYRVLADIPGIQLLGTVRDHNGRPGTGVAITASGEQHELILDPNSSQLLGEQSVNPATGHIDTWTSYLESRYLDAVPAGGTPISNRP